MSRKKQLGKAASRERGGREEGRERDCFSNPELNHRINFLSKWPPGKTQGKSGSNLKLLCSSDKGSWNLDSKPDKNSMRKDICWTIVLMIINGKILKTQITNWAICEKNDLLWSNHFLSETEVSNTGRLTQTKDHHQTTISINQAEAFSKMWLLYLLSLRLWSEWGGGASYHDIKRISSRYKLLRASLWRSQTRHGSLLSPCYLLFWGFCCCCCF